MKMRRQKVPMGMFGSERELCQALIDAARAAGYQAHPECGSWDTLLVCRETGVQIGVHAKLRPSIEVVSQALGRSVSEPGPQVHAVLVPFASPAFLRVARTCDLHVFQGVHIDRLDLPAVLTSAPPWNHPSKEWAPEVEMRFPAGVPSPRRSSRWKMNAVKLCLLAREQGFVTRADMIAFRLHPHWWVSKKFGQVLERRVVDGERLRGQYVLRDPSSQLVPDLRWPEIVDALQAAADLRVPKTPKVPAMPAGPRLRKRQPVANHSTILPAAMKPIVSVPADNKQFPEGNKLASRK